MPITNVQNPFTPIEIVLLTKNGTTLEILFTTRKTATDSEPAPCGNVIKLSCSSDGVSDVGTIYLVWRPECGSWQEFPSTDDPTPVVITKTPDNSDPTTDIKIVIDESIEAEKTVVIARKNYFQLYADLGSSPIKTLLSRGVIYSEIL